MDDFWLFALHVFCISLGTLLLVGLAVQGFAVAWDQLSKWKRRRREL